MLDSYRETTDSIITNVLFEREREKERELQQHELPDNPTIKLP